MDREGAATRGDIALVGDEVALNAAVSQIQDAGTTELIAVLLETEPGAKQRTMDYLQSLL